MIAGASAHDGKSLTAANIAAAYARAGKRVVLIDGDLHRPTQQRFFRLKNNLGLTTALRGDAPPVESLLQSTAAHTACPHFRPITAQPSGVIGFQAYERGPGNPVLAERLGRC
ncbi:MAG: hypothetical protein R2932_56850 [Caldilineaceae bacterium]